MAIGEQFAGLPMDQLIGAPLSATADASIRLANSTADFINKVGFNKDGKVRSVAFSYGRRSMNEDGTSNLDEMRVDVPMLAIVPIPNLQVDEVNILFDMEVKQSEREEKNLDIGANINTTMNFGIVKVSVSGSVSAHQSNTRSSDNSAKYHVDVRATNHGIPEGLARVLDMMAANISPTLVGSAVQDGNGQALPEQARAKAERLKAIRQEISQIESRLTAAQNGLDNSIKQLKTVGSDQYGEYSGKLNAMMNKVENLDKQIKAAASDEERAALEKKKAENDQIIEGYQDTLEEVRRCWTLFQDRAADNVNYIACGAESTDGLSPIFALKAIDDSGRTAEYGTGESQYARLVAAQKMAVDSQKSVKQIDAELFEKKAEYNNAVSGVSAAKANK